MNASERIDRLLNHLKMSAPAFASAIGKDRPQFIYDIQKGKTKNISQSLVKQIISVFSDINEIWLLTGEGEMLKQDNPQPKSEDTSLLQLLVDSMKNTIEIQKALLDAKQAEIERLQRAMEEKFGKEPK